MLNDSPAFQELLSHAPWIWGWEIERGDMRALFMLANKHLLLLIEPSGQDKCFRGHSSESQAENRDELCCHHLQRLLVIIVMRGVNDKLLRETVKFQKFICNFMHGTFKEVWAFSFIYASWETIRLVTVLGKIKAVPLNYMRVGTWSLFFLFCFVYTVPGSRS